MNLREPLREGPKRLWRSAQEQLMEEVCERENCKQAVARVKLNKGSPGIDGMTVEHLPGRERALASNPGTDVERDLQTAAGEASRDTEAGRRSAYAWHSNVV